MHVMYLMLMAVQCEMVKIRRMMYIVHHIIKDIAEVYQGSYRKIHSKIHKLFTNLCNMAQKSNTKVCNSAAHLVKGRNPYCSQRLMH